MPIEYRIDRDGDIIEETWTGTVTIHDLQEYWRGYLADPDVLALRRTVVDLRAADIAFSGTELDALVRAAVVPVLTGRKWVSAFVVSRPVQFGVSRQYQAFADSYSQHAIFTDITAAANWLRSRSLDA